MGLFNVLGIANTLKSTLVSKTVTKMNLNGSTGKIKLFDVPSGKQLKSVCIEHTVYNGVIGSLPTTMKVYLDNTVIYTKSYTAAADSGFHNFSSLVDLSGKTGSAIYYDMTINATANYGRAQILSVYGLAE